MTHRKVHGRRQLLQGALGLCLGAAAWGAPGPLHEIEQKIVELPAPPAASASSPPPIEVSSEPTLEIGVVLSLTGQQAAFGVDVRDGIEFAIRQLPTHDALRGHRLKLLIVDDEGDARTAVARVLELALRPKVIAIIGSVQSAIAK